jgi:hypothetical protein
MGGEKIKAKHNINVMDMTRMTKKNGTIACLNTNGLTKLNGFVCTSCFKAIGHNFTLYPQHT